MGSMSIDSINSVRGRMKPFTVIAIVVFAVVSLLHLLRYFLGWEVVVNSVTIPMWFSIVGFVVTGALPSCSGTK